MKKLKTCLAIAPLILAASMAHATILYYSVTLNGASESPANPSPGTGTGLVTIDDLLNTMQVQVTFSGLIGNVTASHIHAATAVAGTGTAGVATQTPTFTGFPLGGTSGTYDHTFDMTQATSFNASYITANGGTPAFAFAALEAAANGGKAYLNIHTNGTGGFPGGEIRGFLTATPVPEPTSLGLIGAGCVIAFARRRRS